MPTEHYGWLFGLNILLMMVVTFVNSRLVKGGRRAHAAIRPDGAAAGRGPAHLQRLEPDRGLWGIVIPVVLFVGHISLVGPTP